MSRQFTEEEARAIFARAARRPQVAPAPDGLTVEELVEIGRQAGLDPALVVAEARAEGADAPARTWHGVPVGVRRSRVLPSRVSGAEWEQIVDLLRAEFKGPGTAEQIGQRREWTSTRTSTAVRVTVERRPEGDRVEIAAPDAYRLPAMLLVALLGGMALALGVLIGVTEGAGVGLGVGGLLAILSLVLYGALFLTARVAAARAPARFESLLDRIDLASRSDLPTEAAAPSAAPALDLDALDLDALPEPAPEAPVGRRRTRS